MILIVASEKDIASMNIARKLIEHYDFEKTSETFDGNPMYLLETKRRKIKLVFTKKDLIYTQDITQHFDPNLIIYISRHSSASGKPTLSVHTPGNLTEEANYGGLPRKVSIAPASAMKDALKEMESLRQKWNLEYEVCYECTHHGPSLDAPTMFVELGSSITQWKDLKAAEAVAHAAMKAATSEDKYMAVLGMGGPHYNLKFTKVALNEEMAFGHMVPKHMIGAVNVEVLKQCIERTLEKVETAILDWKGIRGIDKQPLLEKLEAIGVNIKKV